MDNGRSVAYTYDPLSRLSTALTTGSANYPQWGLSWGYDRYGNRLNQCAVVARYSQGLNIDEPLAESRSGTTSYYQADGLGSVTMLSNPTGAVAANYTYDSFGNIIATSGSIVNNFRYTGREW